MDCLSSLEEGGGGKTEVGRKEGKRGHEIRRGLRGRSSRFGRTLGGSDQNMQLISQNHRRLLEMEILSQAAPLKRNLREDHEAV